MPINFLEYLKDDTTLDISLVKDFDVQALVYFLSHHKKVTAVKLRHSMAPFENEKNNITYAKILFFICSMKNQKLTHIEELDLSANNIGNTHVNIPTGDYEYNLFMQWTYVAVTNFVSNIWNSFKFSTTPLHNPAYSSFIAQSIIEYLGNALISGYMDNLKKLSLSNTELSDYDLAALCKTISDGGIPNLVTLDLSFNNLTDIGLSNIIFPIKNHYLDHLKILNLAANHINSTGAISLMRAFTYDKNSNIQVIKLNDNIIGDEAIDVILKSISKLIYLETIHLCENKFSPKAIQDITIKLMHSDSRLEYFNIGDKYDLITIPKKPTTENIASRNSEYRFPTTINLVEIPIDLSDEEQDNSAPYHSNHSSPSSSLAGSIIPEATEL